MDRRLNRSVDKLEDKVDKLESNLSKLAESIAKLADQISAERKDRAATRVNSSKKTIFDRIDDAEGRALRRKTNPDIVKTPLAPTGPDYTNIKNIEYVEATKRYRDADTNKFLRTAAAKAELERREAEKKKAQEAAQNITNTTTTNNNTNSTTNNKQSFRSSFTQMAKERASTYFKGGVDPETGDRVHGVVERNLRYGRFRNILEQQAPVTAKAVNFLSDTFYSLKDKRHEEEQKAKAEQEAAASAVTPQAASAGSTSFAKTASNQTGQTRNPRVTKITDINIKSIDKSVLNDLSEAIVKAMRDDTNEKDAENIAKDEISKSKNEQRNKESAELRKADPIKIASNEQENAQKNESSKSGNKPGGNILKSIIENVIGEAALKRLGGGVSKILGRGRSLIGRVLKGGAAKGAVEGAEKVAAESAVKGGAESIFGSGLKNIFSGGAKAAGAAASGIAGATAAEPILGAAVKGGGESIFGAAVKGGAKEPIFGARLRTIAGKIPQYAERFGLKGASKIGLSGVAKLGSRGIPILGAGIGGALDAYDEYKKSGNLGKSLFVGGTSTLGGLGGQLLGGAVGSAVGPGGTLVGEVGGGIVGNAGGAAAGRGIYDTGESFIKSVFGSGKQSDTQRMKPAALSSQTQNLERANKQNLQSKLTSYAPSSGTNIVNAPTTVNNMTQQSINMPTIPPRGSLDLKRLSP